MLAKQHFLTSCIFHHMGKHEFRYKLIRNIVLMFFTTYSVTESTHFSK